MTFADDKQWPEDLDKKFLKEKSLYLRKDFYS